MLTAQTMDESRRYDSQRITSAVPGTTHTHSYRLLIVSVLGAELVVLVHMRNVNIFIGALIIYSICFLHYKMKWSKDIQRNEAAIHCTTEYYYRARAYPDVYSYRDSSSKNCTKWNAWECVCVQLQRHRHEWPCDKWQYANIQKPMWSCKCKRNNHTQITHACAAVCIRWR